MNTENNIWTFKKYVFSCSIAGESVEKHTNDEGTIKIVFRDESRYFDNQAKWMGWLEKNMSDEEHWHQNFRALALLVERLFGVELPMLKRARERVLEKEID